LRRASKRRWKHLLTERVEDTKPHIPIGQRFWPLSQRERRAVDALCATEALRALVTSLSCRKDDAAVDVVDAAYWVKGCSSLGRLRIAVLARVESSSLEDGQLCLIDIKEATRACAPRYGDARMPKVDAERVVAGALHLSPFLGKRMRAARLLGRSVFVRELLPRDMKFDFETLPRAEAAKVARSLARVVGRAHARQLDRDARTRWGAELRRSRRKSLGAPSWLWNAVVQLVASHEAGYLEHCHGVSSAAVARGDERSGFVAGD